MTLNTTDIITEITPLSEKDCFYLADRTKDEFTFPIHRHDEFELNLVTNATGAVRIVGDSVQTIGAMDLVFLGHGVEHAWQQGECRSDNITETTIQFSKNLFGDVFLGKNQMASIREMLNKASYGIAFSEMTIMKVFHLIEKLRAEPPIPSFYRVMTLITLLYELSISEDYQILASSSFVKLPSQTDSRRILKVQQYIGQHYREDISLEELAKLVGMTRTSFSRFFKLRTGRHVSDYIIEVRLGHATRALVDSTTSVAEICYDCGFNNVSYFNRIFKKKKGCSPKEFRKLYRRNSVLL